jgi:hypothetical protein
VNLQKSGEFDPCHADWRHHELVTDAPASVAAMPQAYNVWFVLETKSRVRGSIYLDQVGLMVRRGPGRV